MWGFFLLFSSCNFFHQDPVVFSQTSLPVGSKLCFIGDTGSGKKQQMAVAKILSREGCADIHMLGDIIYKDGLSGIEDKNFTQKFVGPYKELLESTPLYISLGNHDYQGNTQVWYDIAKNYKNIIFPSPFYHQKLGDICITTLDTNAFFIKQLLWLDDISSEFAGCKFSIFTGHHPLISSGAHGDSPFIVREFIKRALSPNTKVYISGHEHHLSDEGQRDGVRYLISGAGGKLRPLRKKAKVWGESKAGYLVLTLQASSPIKFGYEFIGVVDSKRVVLHTAEISE